MDAKIMDELASPGSVGQVEEAAGEIPENDIDEVD